MLVIDGGKKVVKMPCIYYLVKFYEEQVKNFLTTVVKLMS